MVEIPERKMLRIEELLESGYVKPEKPRAYLGVSQIGKPCQRQIWYGFRWYLYEKISPRMARLFKRGHLEEPIIHKDLKSAGVKIISKQEGATTAEGHISGHNDGKLLKVPDAPKTKHLNEIKTANDRSFKKLIACRDKKADNQTAVELWNLTYYIQIVVYMYLFKLKRCLYIVVNKNDDERFYERIKCNNKLAKDYLEKGVDIINSNHPPERIGNKDFYYCKAFKCPFYFICHCNRKPNKTCRSCKHSEPVKKGKWYCKKTKKNISYKKQLKACKKYSIIKDR